MKTIQILKSSQLRFHGTIATLLSLLFTADMSDGAVLLFTDRNSFLNVTVNEIYIDFAATNTSGGDTTDYSTASGLTISGTKFIGVIGSSFSVAVFSPAHDPLRSGWSGDPTVLNGPNGSSNYVVATLPANTTAVGFDLYTVSGTSSQPFGIPLQVTLSTGDTFTIPTFDKPTLAFAGFTSDIPISSVRIADTTSDHNPNISSFIVAQVPEPSACILGAVGATIYFLRRRKHQ